MKVTAALVKSLIRESSVDVLVVEDMAKGEKIGYYNGPPETMCDRVDELERNIDGPYKLRGSWLAMDKRRGNKTNDQKPFLWLMGGSAVPAPAPAPVPVPVPAPGPAPVGTLNGAALPLEFIKEAAGHEAKGGYLELQLDALRQEVNDLRDQLAEADEEINAVPVAVAPKWFETEAGVKAIADMVQPIISGIMMRPRSRLAAPVATAQATAAPDASEDARMLAAIRRFEATDPATAKALKDQLLNEYGNDNAETVESTN